MEAEVVRRRTLAGGLAVLALAAAGGLAAVPGAPVDRSGLARGRHATLHALFEATIFRIDVLTVDVTVDPDTQRVLTAIVRGRARTRAIEVEVTRAIVGAKQALVEARFLRDVDLSDFLDEARKQLDLAARAKLVTPAESAGARARLGRLLARIESRGFEDGDRLVYRVKPGTLRMLLRSARGEVLVDERIVEPRAGAIVLASYLAPGHALRTLLVGSLFR
jgi:hypothetical protein